MYVRAFDSTTTASARAELSERDLRRADAFGACVSLACAVHCMALPFVLTTLPLLGIGFLAHEWFEIFMLVFSVGLASASLCWGSKIHGQRRILLLPAMAVMLFLAAQSLPEGDMLEALMVSTGALCIALGHLLNRKLCHSCTEC